MAFDENGIWQYEEGEFVTPFSEFLNRLAESTSVAVGDLWFAIPDDTGWVPLTLENGWTASEGTPAVRRIGDVVYMKGVVTGGTSNPIAVLDEEFRPSEARRFWVYSPDAGLDGTLCTVFSAGGVSAGGTFPSTSLAECIYPI